MTLAYAGGTSPGCLSLRFDFFDCIQATDKLLSAIIDLTPHYRRPNPGESETVEMVFQIQLCPTHLSV